ncbi:unnamed protein product [Cyclocybe aegerita]|uniref:F-box domain-containing protein n=1 Tax=Cyclocybe aegerita TaxID=1973307 RepID=A0A8S0VZS7_CYCAE|nr:unnamed protein product [Cyclocybe aegerita]
MAPKAQYFDCKSQQPLANFSTLPATILSGHPFGKHLASCQLAFVLGSDRYRRVAAAHLFLSQPPQHEMGHPSFSCSLCGMTGILDTIDVSGAHCGLSAREPCLACAQLKQIDEKIQETATMLQTLLKERQELKFQRNKHHDQIVNRLPPELVSRIFTEACYPDTRVASSRALQLFPHISEGVDQGNQNPLQLQMVCRTWREIALSNPRIWSTIWVNMGWGGHEPYRQFIQEWISRSRDLPLSLILYEIVYQYPIYDREHLARMRHLFDVINNTSSRWRELNFFLSEDLVKMLGGDTIEAPVLESVFRGRFLNEYGGGYTAPFILRVRPSPTHVSLDMCKHTGMAIDWGQVTHVEMKVTSVDNVLGLLPDAPSITHLTLHSVHVFSLPPNLPDEIIHNHLRVLKVPTDSWRREAMDPLLDRLTLPSLEELHIGGSLLQTTNLILRSHCRITKLNIDQNLRHLSYRDGEPESDFIALLREVPFLTDLTFIGRISSTFLERLRLAPTGDTGDSEVFLPALRSSDIKCFLEFEWECVANIFPAHPSPLNGHRSALQSFKLTVSKPVTRNRQMPVEGDSGNECTLVPIPDGVFDHLLGVRESTGIQLSIVNDSEENMLYGE